MLIRWHIGTDFSVSHCCISLGAFIFGMDDPWQDPWEVFADGPPDEGGCFDEPPENEFLDVPYEEKGEMMDVGCTPGQGVKRKLPDPAVSAQEPAFKRRRLTFKQSRPTGVDEPILPLEEQIPSTSGPCLSSMAHYPDQIGFLMLNHRQRYKMLYYRFTRWVKMYRRQCIDVGDLDTAMRLTTAEGGKGLDKDLCDKWLGDTSAPQWVADWCTIQWAPKERYADLKWLVAKSVLLTWNGEWGDVGVPSASTDPDASARELRCNPKIKDLWEEFIHFIEQVGEETKIYSWSATMELCTKRLAEDGSVKVHIHAYMKKEDGKFSIRNPVAVSFKGSKPHKSAYICGQRLRQYGTWAGSYYVSTDKIGTVFSQSTHNPHVDYSVNPQWISTMLSTGKITITKAREEFIYTGNSLTRRLGDLDKYERELRGLCLKQHIELRLRELSGKVMPFRSLPEVNQWMLDCHGANFRKKFLVLEGGSGLGKTEYAKRLTGNQDECYEVNMANGDDFDLRGFVPLRHKTILWDEAAPSLVAAQRKLFQCPACWVDLGTSSTGCYAYRVWVNDCMMIICSNKWSQELRRMPFLDAKWLIDNQVHVVLTETMIAS